MATVRRVGAKVSAKKLASETLADKELARALSAAHAACGKPVVVFAAGETAEQALSTRAPNTEVDLLAQVCALVIERVKHRATPLRHLAARRGEIDTVRLEYNPADHDWQFWAAAARVGNWDRPLTEKALDAAVASLGITDEDDAAEMRDAGILMALQDANLMMQHLANQLANGPSDAGYKRVMQHAAELQVIGADLAWFEAHQREALDAIEKDLVLTHVSEPLMQAYALMRKLHARCVRVVVPTDAQRALDPSLPEHGWLVPTRFLPFYSEWKGWRKSE